MSKLTPPTASIPALLLKLRPQMGIGLLVLALLFAGVVVYLLWQQGSVAMGRPVFFWAVFLAIASLVHGLLVVVSQERQDPESLENYRLQVMTYGAIAGVATAILGLALPFTNDYYPIYAEGLAKWREKPSALAYPTLAFLSGLVLLFLSLNLARGTERSSGVMRRLLYGYNVVLSSILLLLILLLVNVLAYVKLRPFDVMGRTVDMTSSGIYSISEPTRAVLRSLSSPVHVTVLLEGTQFAQEMENLLETCSTYSTNFHWKSLDVHSNRKEIQDLQKKYKIPDAMGVLVVLTQDGQELHHFIEPRELVPDVSEDEQRGARFEFAGENALLNCLRFLLDGKSKPQIYFFQGHGALNLDQNDPASRQSPDIGLGVLRKALTDRGYEVHPLRLNGEKPEIPANADIVVIPRPTTPVPQTEIDVLLAYANGTGRAKKGKLFILGDVIPDGAGFRNTGIESLVGNFNVRFRNERLLSLQGPNDPSGAPDPLLLGVGPVRDQGFGPTVPANPISRAVFDRTMPDPFRFYDVRMLEVGENNPAAPGAYVVEPFLFPWVDEGIWAESDLSKNPESLLAHYKTNIPEFRKVVKQTSIPVAVTISEAGPNRNPHAGSTVPRHIIFSDATWISNYGTERLTRKHLDLFGSCINWLRDKPAAEKLVKEKDRREYTLNLSKAADFWNLALIPGALLVLLTIALGLGVWVVRRR